MKKVFFFIAVSFFYLGYSQNITISGYVEDKESGEKLIGATVYDKNTLKGTITNDYGFYSLTLPAGNINLEVSYIGFLSYQEELNLVANEFKNIALELDNELDEVVVTASSESVHQKTQMSAIELSVAEIEKLPAFMGEVDIIKSIQLLPGIQSGTEASAGLYVRGGGPDQNLILLDGVPLYNVNHLFGFFSVFNSTAINKVEIIKGGFPAQYGGRISSVLDIRMKEGNNKKFKGEASIGIISSKLTLEGPILKDKTSFIVSGRRTYADILAQPFLPQNNNGRYYFYDLNTKINHKFSDKSKLYLSNYIGRDRLGVNMTDTYNDEEDISKFRLSWGNISSTIRYSQIFNEKLFGYFTGIYTKYDFLIDVNTATTKNLDSSSPTVEETNFDYTSIIYDVGAKIEFDYIPSSNHYIKFGLTETYHTFVPGVTTVVIKTGQQNVNTSFGETNIYAHEIMAYLQDDIKIGKKFRVNLGAAYSMFLVLKKQYQNFQPRIATNYLLKENMSVKASYSKTAQYIHLLSNGTVDFPTDLWVPVTNKIPAVEADQFAIGWNYTYKDNYEFNIEAYYKEMYNLIDYKDGESFFDSSTDWQEKVEIGRGTAYGLEVFVRKKVGKTTGWLGYTLSRTNRHFRNLNFGLTYPYKFDRRHDISLVLLHETNKKWGKKQWALDYSLAWIYGTGNAVTLSTSEYNAINSNFISQAFNDSSTITNYNLRNSYREPAYHRMDISFNIKSTKYKKIQEHWALSVYNLYNRQNPFYLFFDQDDNNNNVLKQLSIFPVIPNVTYKIKF